MNDEYIIDYLRSLRQIREMAEAEITTKIIEAAGKRIFHYGYNKTTMAEIARDCNMSTGNLYRYFENKLAIARALGRAIREQELAALGEVATDQELSPVARLKRFFKTKLQKIYARFHGDKKAFDLSQTLRAEVPDFWDTWLLHERRLLTEVFREGEAAGEIHAGEDPMHTAELFQAALYQFTSPAVFYSGELEQLESELDEILDLLIDGLKERARREAMSRQAS